ncbi:MAG: HAD family hydrolase [Evtepia sp.]
MVRLIGLDLDGTLLDEKKEITPKTRLALLDAMARGIIIVPVTGRPFGGIPEVVRDLPGLRYVISSNGATVLDGAKTIFARHIPLAETLTILEKVPGGDVQVFLDGFGYAEKETFRLLCARNQGSPLLPYVTATRRIVPETLEAFVRAEGRSVEELLIRGASKSLTQALYRLPRLTFLSSWEGVLEITADGIDKGKAFLQLAAHLGISQTETMAFGDGGNDLTFLQSAAHSIAMSNATEEVKAIAHYVTRSNEEDGIALVINQLLRETL